MHSVGSTSMAVGDLVVPSPHQLTHIHSSPPVMQIDIVALHIYMTKLRLMALCMRMFLLSS